MKKKCLVSVCILFMTFFSMFTQLANGQNTLVWIEVPSDSLNINDEIPEGKTLFIFDAEEGFHFESDATLVEEPKRDGSLYKFLVDIEPTAGGITIKHKGISSNNYIPWGKDNSISLPPLQNKAVKFFKLFLYTTLDCYDVTPETKKSGSIYYQALYEKEALIILNVVPVDLNLTISGSDITNIVTEEGIFKVYVKPVGQQIFLKSNNYDDYIIEFDNDELKTKDVRYYHVQPPPSTKGIETFDSNMKVSSYTIESMPAGALIQIIGNKAFNERQFRTPYTIENYKEGNKVITLALDRYETILDTILISSTAGKKSTYNLIPNFALINLRVEPAIPISKVLMDGKELSMIENGNDYECPKGFHVIEFDAPGFYSEIRQVSFVAGKTHEMDVRLKPNTSSSTNSLSNSQTVGAGYQSNVARYQPAPTSKYSRSTWTVNQRTPAAFNQNTPATEYNRSTSTMNQRTVGVGYNQRPTTVNQGTPSAGYKRTTTTVNQRTPAAGYKSTTSAFDKNVPSAEYNRTPTTTNQRTQSSGYSRTPSTANPRTSAAGYKSTTTTVKKRTPTTGYKSTTTVNKRAPYTSPYKYNKK